MGNFHKEMTVKIGKLLAIEKVNFRDKNAKISVDKDKKVYYNYLRDESNDGESLSEKAFHIRVRSP